MRLVRGIWKVLRFETEAGSMPIDPSAFASDRPIEKVTAIKLETRLGRMNFQDAPCCGLRHPRSHEESGG